MTESAEKDAPLCPEHDHDVPMMAVPCFVEGCNQPHWLCPECNVMPPGEATP